MKPKLYVVAGPTATGKTAFARNLARTVRGEIINADSRQMYRGLDTISGKDLAVLATFHHVSPIRELSVGYYQSLTPGDISTWLYDCADIPRQISAYDFRTIAEFVIKDIVRRGRVPILVGGTYFYLKSLLYDIETYHVPPNSALRKELEHASVLALQHRLSTLDPQWLASMNESDRANPRRLIRKIEIASVRDIQEVRSNQGVSLPARNPFLSEFDVVCIGKKPPGKDEYRQIIHNRVHIRVAHGAVEEYEKCFKQFPDSAYPGFTTIGCREIAQYLSHEISKDELIDLWTTREVQYAKRQMTFLKRDAQIEWVS